MTPNPRGQDVITHDPLLHKENDMVILGLILLILGLVLGISILVTIGAILAVVGLVLNLVPMGSGPRRRYY